MSRSLGNCPEHHIVGDPSSRLAALIAWSVFALCLSTQAAEQASAPAGTDSSLSLRDLVSRVMEQNRQISAQRVEWDVSAWRIKAEEGVFEPVFQLNTNYQKGERRNSAEEQSSQLFTNSSGIYVHTVGAHSARVQGLLPLGTSYSVGLSMNQLSNTVNKFEDEYVSFAGIQLTQPLLRGFGEEITKAKIHLAQQEYEIKRQELRRRLMSTVAEAESRYWDLALKHEKVRMRQESVTRAATILADARERLEVGKVSTLDVARAETGLLLRRTQVQAAEQEALEASNAVRTLLSESPVESTADLVPSEKPSYSARVLNLEASLSQSLKNSPDYLVAAKQLEQEKTRVGVAMNAKKPQLDLVASCGLNGWGDTVNETQDSLERNEYETWSVGLEFSIGLGGDRRARSELHGLKLRQKRQELVLRDLETQLANLLATTMGKLGNLAAQLQSLEDVASFNERLLSVAIERLKQGKGDMRDVLQFEEDLVAANDRRLEALTGYQKALLELEAFEGTLLENRGITITSLDEPAGQKE